MKNYEQLKQYILSKKHRQLRQDDLPSLAEEYSKLGLSPEQRMSKRFELLCEKEQPIVFENERIAFIRTIKKLPEIFTKSEWEEIRKTHYIHELGYNSNICPDYEKILKIGLKGLKNNANENSCRSVDALIRLCERYIEQAKKVNNYEVAENISSIIDNGATSFYSALQLFRIVHFALWLEGNYHVTIGAFDRYMYPYYKNDIDNGIIDQDQAYLLLEEFFLSFNRDSDLYPGVQQGDNGQSMVLGGLDECGRETFNSLSKMCLKASGNLMLIDPKINIRVNKNTPLEIFELGTELTKKGLGFPQYTNDDIAIPALEKLGYSHKDACDYVMAACWELIIPRYGTDVANISALSFAKVIDNCFNRDLINCSSMEQFVDCVKNEINTQCDQIENQIKNLWFIPSPFLNVCMAQSITDGGKYNNFGIHGTGICTGADSLCAIEKLVFNEKSITKQDYIKAVKENFINSPELLHALRYETPKVGQNDDSADKYLVTLLESFSCALKNRTNCRGGKFRAGTGSAMYYLWHADQIGASPDGRREKEPLGTNFSVSLFADIGGPISLVQSLTKPNFIDAMNGGPVTLEFSESMWNGQDVEKKFAKFIKTFIAMNGHQIQLNSINVEKLLDAQIHPENYERLVVRIWGWSAYFTELDKEYQNHVIARQRYQI